MISGHQLTPRTARVSIKTQQLTRVLAKNSSDNNILPCWDHIGSVIEDQLTSLEQSIGSP
jgi:hypothetical protein